jgi:[FeFe] hydrogenase H-cluster maturation GTPase HydF
MSVVVQDTELADTIARMGVKPRMVITDSQVFAKAAAATPEDIPLTSFSILLARYKGLLETAVRGAAAIQSLRDGDRILISEGCTHHRQCEDIGTVKLPRLLKKVTGKEITFDTSSGSDFPEDLSGYKLVIHCGGCMLPGREVLYRMKCAADQGVPMTNYGIALAHLQGILARSIAIFPDLIRLLEP